MGQDLQAMRNRRSTSRTLQEARPTGRFKSDFEVGICRADDRECDQKTVAVQPSLSSKGADTSAKSNVRPKKSDVIVPATAADILEPWLRASPETRQHAVDAIGLRGWLDAVPREWLP